MRKIKPVVLIIMDGWGVAPPSSGNVINQAQKPNFDRFFATYPHTELIASGESVGLPANEVGSTEVGHLTIGAGRVIPQGLKRVNEAVEDGTFFENPAFTKVIQHVRENHSRLHLLGILSTGNVHGSLEHFDALIEICRRAGLHDVFIHVFTDGRDSPPKEALEVLPRIEKRLKSARIGEIATVSGRYYAMDRDRRWERTEKAYQAIVEGTGQTATSFEEAIQNAYDKSLTDELIEPTVIMRDGAPVATINDNDGAIFFNFRIDRPIQLSMALCMQDFEKADMKQFTLDTITDAPINQKTERKAGGITTFVRNKKLTNFFFVTMMNYHRSIPVSAVAFNTDVIDQPFAQPISERGWSQLHLAESEKARFVGFYFDGYREEVFPQEEIMIVPSPRVSTYDKKPEMSTFDIVRAFKKYLNQDKYNFFVMNIAAPDMVAHTGNIKATIKACEATDKAIGEMVEAILAADGTAFITADHGHAEKLLEYESSSFFFTSDQGKMSTDHSNNPVPFLVINNELRGSTKQISKGALSDIAPTVLAFMGLPIPKHMTGKNLLDSEGGE